MLDFSSEIEFDDRFDAEEYMTGVGAAGSNVAAGQPRIDRSLPPGARPNTKVQRKKNRAKLMEAYKQSVESHEMAQRKVTFDPQVLADTDQDDPVRVAKEREREEKLREQLADEKYSVNIKDFINEQYLYLPTNRQSQAYQLLRALQSAPYAEAEKNGGPTKKNMAFMNEERRKRLGLPPLTQIDYNCLERAALKLKLVIDCLMLSRRMSGFSVVPKDVVVTQMFKQQERRREWHVLNAVKTNKLSRSLLREWGQHVVLETAFNPESAQVQQSVAKIKAFQQNSLMMEQVEGESPQQVAAKVHQNLDLGEDLRKPKENSEPVKTVVFDQDLAELESRYGSGTEPPPGRSSCNFDAFAARHRRIVTEFESYIEDGAIVDQQAIRLPEEATGSSPILISTIRVRKIKSNVENLLQILWERDANDLAKHNPNQKVFTGNRQIDELESDGETGVEAKPAPPEFMETREHEGVKQRNDAQRKALLEKAPKIVRLQSKTCKIMSLHEDVLAYDAEEYPPGTDKISKFMVLDLAQERLDKVQTAFKSYAQVQICSAVSRRQMWDDSVNLPWETFVQFFKVFGIAWDPLAFMKRGHFKCEEAFLFNEYFSRCFYLDHENLHELALDLSRLDFNRIRYEEIFLQLPMHELIPTESVVHIHTEELCAAHSAREEVKPYTRKYFEKFITKEAAFDASDFDKMIFPFFDESKLTMRKLFKYEREKEFLPWIQKFTDPEEQKDIPPLDMKRDLMTIGGMKTSFPVYMVEEQTMKFIRQDPQHMFNLNLSTFNNRQDDLLYLGRLQLANPVSHSKIEQLKGAHQPCYNVKVKYYVSGMIPTLSVMAFDSISMSVHQLQTTNQRHIKMLVRMCNQQSDKMIINQLQSVLSVRSSKLTVGKSLFLNFNRRQLKNKNLDQQFTNMLVCNEQLLQRFVDNTEAAKSQQINNGIKQFKGILRNLTNLRGEGSKIKSWLVNANQYDIHVETLLYYNPMAMIHGNGHLVESQVRQAVLQPLLERNAAIKSFDKVKVWKLNLLDLGSGRSQDILLSLHDLEHFFESDLAKTRDLENPVKLPNLVDLLHDYIDMVVDHRSIIGRVFLWKLPQYKRRVDEQTGRMLPLDPDELYRMKILAVYQQMLDNIEQQKTFEDNNALPLSLDAKKPEPNKARIQPPNLCLGLKSIVDKTMPIYENNSRQILKLVAQDTQVVIQKPKLFAGSFKKTQYCIVTVLLQPSMECWIWQLYFPRT